MVAEKSTDLVVLGAGPGGYAAAFRAADLGMSVSLVDPAPHPGGVYLPLVVLLSWLTDSERFISYFASGWMALGAMVFGAVAFSKCPRCSNLFYTMLFYYNFWARGCIHCGLPLR